MRQPRVLPNISNKEATKAAFEDIRKEQSAIRNHTTLCVLERNIRQLTRHERTFGLITL